MPTMIKSHEAMNAGLAQRTPSLSSRCQNSGGTAAGGSFNAIGAISLKVTPVVAAVPEPVTLSLFSAGLIGAGYLSRRRKMKTA